MDLDTEADSMLRAEKKKKKKKSGAPVLPDLEETRPDAGADASPVQIGGQESRGSDQATIARNVAENQRTDPAESSYTRHGRALDESTEELKVLSHGPTDLYSDRAGRKQSIFAAFSALGLSDGESSEPEQTSELSARKSSQFESVMKARDPGNSSLSENAVEGRDGSRKLCDDVMASRRSDQSRPKKAGTGASNAWTPSDAFSEASKKGSASKKEKSSRANEDDPEIEAILAELDALEEDTSKTKMSKKQRRKARQAAHPGADGEETSLEVLAEHLRDTRTPSDALQNAGDSNQTDQGNRSVEGRAVEDARDGSAKSPDEEVAAVSIETKAPIPQAAYEQEQETSVGSISGAARPDPETEQMADSAEAPERRLTAAQKKRLKKKQKEASKKAETALENSEISSTAAAGPNKAIVRRILAEQQRRAEEEERRRREEEEQRAQELARQRQEEEEARQREEARRLKKEADRARREQLRREGKLLSKTERQRRQRVEAFIQQNMASGTIAAASLPQTATKLYRRVYDDRRKKGPTKASLSTSADGIVTADDHQVDGASVSVSRGNEAIADGAAKEAQEYSKWNRSDDWSDSTSSKEEDALFSDSESADEELSPDQKVQASKISRAQQVGAVLSPEERRQLAIRQRLVDERAARESATSDRLRSPIICILGHVDTGKTKLLDKIRHTHVQEGEAGGITQQIGATFFPIEAVRQEASKVTVELSYRIPSLLIIDTPGHESFTNLRSRGSSICDIAILVVDIMHGLEQQTLESIELLKMRKTPFVVALNKVDRLYGWKACPMSPIRQALEENPQTRAEFEKRVAETKVAFAEIGFNAELYWENADFRRNLSLVPTSAISGEGIPDLLMLLVQLPQRLLVDRLMFVDFPYCTVLEVKVIDGLGTTIDVVLTGGALHEGDTIVVCGLEGPIVTTIRALLTPHPMKEMRVKGQYIHHKRIEAAQGIKISAEGLEKAIAGTQMFVARNADEIDYLKEEVMADLSSTLATVDTSGIGVYVQASTLGSLEALLEFLRKDAKIPVSGVNIGPVHKRDVVRASTMLEHQPEFAVILAFDVKVEREAREEAENLGVQIFTADIIYHLFDHFRKYMEQVKERKKRDAEADVVFPVCATILPDSIFNKRDPLIFGVRIDEGILRCGSNLVAVHEDLGRMVDIGRVLSIESNKKSVTQARRGDNVAVKVGSRQTNHVMYGRQFDHTYKLYSRITRKAIDLLKELYRDELTKEDWQLVLKLKKMFGVL
jgi:translation initiation factor 5B